MGVANVYNNATISTSIEVPSEFQTNCIYVKKIFKIENLHLKVL